MRCLPALLAAAFLAGCSSQATQAPSGGDASRPPAAGRLTIGMMPKSLGIPYFNACEQGARQAAGEMADVDLEWNGPSEDRSEDQSQLLDTWILRRLDAIALACNDPAQIASTLARARDEGLSVVTYDADADAAASKRQFFVNQAEVDAIARALVDEMASQAGAEAEVGVVSSSPTAPNQTAWLKAMESYRAQKYPGMKVVVTEYAGEDQAKSRQKAESILKAYPSVKGIWGMTSVAFPGAAQAVEGAGRKGAVAVVGLGTPQVMKEFVDRGVVKTVILWNPVDLGYLTVHVARAVVRGELKPGATSFQAGRLGEVQVRGDQVLLGDPMRFTKENIGQFSF